LSHDIVIATINARYQHASLGLRYLFANLGDLQARARIREFTLEMRPMDIVEQILGDKPRIVGLGVYIWNVEQCTQVAALIKSVDPACRVVMGGPETGYEDDLPPGADHADYIISGQADVAFRDLCRQLLEDQPPTARFIRADTPSLETLELPYRHYDSEDIAQRLIYVEASRGCPFKCEFCLSSLDRTASGFDLDRFLDEMSNLYQRGARHFKFVDRTFNLKLSTTNRILEFFLDLDDPDLFLHFELIPDRLPEALKAHLVRFRPGTLQFEIGIQTFNPAVQKLISRRQDDALTRANLLWLRQHTAAHIHADLIFGLPGEDLESFADGFNTLYELGPHEIQVGILKRLRGTPILRHESERGLRFNPAPPYNILCSDSVDFATLQRVQRFARYFDMIANSGRFPHTMILFDASTIFQTFLALCDWLFRETGKTHRIALPRLFDLVHQGCVNALGMDTEQVLEALRQDYLAGGFKGMPKCLDRDRPHVPMATRALDHSARQARHLSARKATLQYRHTSGDKP
jgi:radical SAM superfamily enzyme YgiQ (UPF0313 family)